MQVPYADIPSGTEIKVEASANSSIYVALDIDNGRDGGLMEAFSQQGWTLMSGEVRYTAHGGNTYPLSAIWKKTLTTETSVSFITANGKLTHSIFIGKCVLIKVLHSSTQKKYELIFANL